MMINHAPSIAILARSDEVYDDSWGLPGVTWWLLVSEILGNVSWSLMLSFLHFTNF